MYHRTKMSSEDLHRLIIIDGGSTVVEVPFLHRMSLIRTLWYP